jgi:hypothetical protein
MTRSAERHADAAGRVRDVEAEQIVQLAALGRAQAQRDPMSLSRSRSWLIDRPDKPVPTVVAMSWFVTR